MEKVHGSGGTVIVSSESILLSVLEGFHTPRSAIDLLVSPDSVVSIVPGKIEHLLTGMFSHSW